MNPPLALDPAPLLADWPIEETLRDVDLSLNDRSRVSALPWRGQFSPLTVERLLTALAPRDAVVLDPFVGSGTSLLEAARRKHSSVGLDVNPAAIAFAQCACLASLRPEERRERLRDALSVAASQPPGLPDCAEKIDLAHAVSLLAVNGTLENAGRRLEDLVNAMPASPVPTEVVLGDARKSGLPSASAGFAVTSPPYINVFNYHQVGRPLSDGFGWPVLAAARSEIGSNRQNRGNRFRTVVQYAIDMALVLTEVCRVLTPGSTAVLVLGRTSRVRGVSFFNGEIAAQIVERLGLFGARSRAERRFVNRFGSNIFEDVLVLKESAMTSRAADEVEQVGRAVGTEALEQASHTADTISLIDSAITEAAEISPSPMAAEMER